MCTLWSGYTPNGRLWTYQAAHAVEPHAGEAERWDPEPTPSDGFWLDVMRGSTAEWLASRMARQPNGSERASVDLPMLAR